MFTSRNNRGARALDRQRLCAIKYNTQLMAGHSAIAHCTQRTDSHCFIRQVWIDILLQPNFERIRPLVRIDAVRK